MRGEPTAIMTRQKPLNDIIGEKCIGSSSFRHIYEEHWADLFSLAVVILRDKDAAKDAVQDIFVSILKKENTDEIQNIKSYLFQSLRHQCFMRLRSIRIASKHRENVSVQLQENTTDHAVDFHFSNLDMERTIASLPGKCREIFLLSRFSDLSNKEIADQLNISSKTVENQITRAIKTLRLSLIPKCLWLGVLSLIIK